MVALSGGFDPSPVSEEDGRTGGKEGHGLGAWFHASTASFSVDRSGPDEPHRTQVIWNDGVVDSDE